MVAIVDDRQLAGLELLADHFPCVADEHPAALIDEVLKDYVEDAVVTGHFEEGHDFERGELQLLQFFLH